MKTKLVSFLGLTVALAFLTASPAIAAYSLDSATISATCDDYTITVTGHTDQTDHTIKYVLTATPTSGESPIEAEGSFVVNGEFDESFTFDWPVDLECGSYFITSHIYMPCIYHLYPETDLDCPCYGECETDLIAGQDWDSPAGVVTIWNDDVNLYVTFETTGGWELGETHLYVGATPPKKSAPGKFPYTDQTEYTIPLSDFPDVCILYIAAHAVVSQGDQEETAWADTYGITFGKSWAMFVMYNVCEGGCLEVQAAVENADTLRIVDELGCPLD